MLDLSKQVNQTALFILWGFSSVGRAPALQAGCQRFESANLHYSACSKTTERLLAGIW
jgi:hypothetical protein